MLIKNEKQNNSSCENYEKSDKVKGQKFEPLVVIKVEIPKLSFLCPKPAANNMIKEASPTFRTEKLIVFQ